MKMPKTRIKIIETNGGVFWYKPQFRVVCAGRIGILIFFFPFLIINNGIVNVFWDEITDSSYSDIKYAQNAIDSYLNNIKLKEKDKIKKVTYQKYP